MKTHLKRNCVGRGGSAVRIASLSFLTAFCFVCLADLAHGGDSAKLSQPAPPGEAIYYYNAAIRVDLVLALDEFQVLPPSEARLDREAYAAGVRARLPEAEVRFVDDTARMHVRMITPARDRRELQQRAEPLQAAGYQVQAVAYPPTASDRPASARHVLTNRLSVKLAGPSSINDLAAAYRLVLIEEVSYSPRTYILETSENDLLASVRVANSLYEGEGVEFATPLIAHRYSTRLVPNDTLFPNQWHLRNTGQVPGTSGNDVNIVDAWDQVTGTGINVLITDEGVEEAHEDLSPNARTDLSHDYLDGDTDPAPGTGENHGTAVAGVAAARGNNNMGVAGAGFTASLVGVRLLGFSMTDSKTASAMGHLVSEANPANRAHINSNSWGPADDGATLETFGPLAKAAIENGVANGRGGLGIVYVWAAGNGRQNADNVNFDGWASSRYTIAVGATGAGGRFSPYSEPGASMLVNTPSSYLSAGITTTDRTGSAGYAAGNYTSNFGGTSSAAPLASGIIALILAQNPNLTWRDVQHILVDTATKNDPTDSGWIANGSGRWFNHAYGFGRVDATAAVNAAAAWVNVLPNATPLTASESVSDPIPDNDPDKGITRSLDISSAQPFVTEHVEVTVNITHPYRGDLQIEITSPARTRSILATPRPSDDGDNFSNWMFTSVACWGEDPSGTWQLKIVDTAAQNTGSLNSWSLTVHGFLETIPTTWEVSPSSTFPSSGVEGGPFSPTSKAYEIRNISGPDFNWQVTTSQPWLTTDVGSGGPLAPGESDTVTVQLTPEADTLGTGVYTDSVFFTNLTSGESVIRVATLDVNAPSPTRPEVSNVRIAPTAPKTTDDLTLTYTYSDPNGDPQVGEEIRWRRNGLHQPAYDNTNPLPAGATARGQTWYAEVRASDGVEWSLWTASNVVTIGNLPPVLDSIGNKTATVGDILQFPVSATDPDNDPLTYSVTVAGQTAGISMNPATGLFRWDTASATAQNYSATFTVSDNGTPPLTDQETIVITLEAFCPQVSAPTGLQASDGTFPDRVRVTFTAVPGAVHYRIYRAETDNLGSAALIGNWALTTFDDFSVEHAPGPIMSCPGSPATHGKLYYYWVSAYNGCRESAKTGPDTGRTGLGAKSLLQQTVVYEKVLPALSIAPNVQKTAIDSELAIRLRSDLPVHPETVWAEVSVNGANSDFVPVLWIARNEDNGTDSWVVFVPAAPFEFGSLVTMTVGAALINGEDLEPITYQFSVESEADYTQRIGGSNAIGSQPSSAVTEEPLAVVEALDPTTAPPTFEGSVGPIYRVAPEQVFAPRRQAWLPVPAGYLPGQLELYYFLGNGADAGWHPAWRVQGWLEPGSIEQVESGGVFYLGLKVNHGATVQFGLEGASLAPAPAGLAAPATFSPKTSADLLLLAVIAVFLIVAGRSYALARNLAAKSRPGRTDL